jgi:hypothetical protein
VACRREVSGQAIEARGSGVWLGGARRRGDTAEGGVCCLLTVRCVREARAGDGRRLVWSRTAANEGPAGETVSPSKGFTDRLKRARAGGSEGGGVCGGGCGRRTGKRGERWESLRQARARERRDFNNGRGRGARTSWAELVGYDSVERRWVWSSMDGCWSATAPSRARSHSGRRQEPPLGLLRSAYRNASQPPARRRPAAAAHDTPLSNPPVSAAPAESHPRFPPAVRALPLQFPCPRSFCSLARPTLAASRHICASCPLVPARQPSDSVASTPPGPLSKFHGPGRPRPRRDDAQRLCVTVARPQRRQP